MNTIAFLGLGVMGYPMAGHLSKTGKVVVYNRTAAKAAAWQAQYGGQACSTVAAAVAEADLVLCCLGNDDDVRQVLCGPDGALAQMKSRASLVDHTTTSAALAEELARAAQERGLHFMDAPVSGGQAGAEQGRLTVMCGGERQVFAELERSVFSAYAKSAVYMGPHGQGQRAKMVNQICITGILRGLSEGLLLAEKAGLEVSTLVSCLKNGAAGSWQMENRAATMVQGQYNFGFAIEWMAKDLRYALGEAERHGLDLALARETLQQYHQLIESGHGREDSSCIYRAIRK